MIKRKERTAYTPSVVRKVDVGAKFIVPPWNPPIPEAISMLYQTPSYRRLFEKIWGDDGRSWSNGFYLNRTSWKPCQHYKCVVADTAESLHTGEIPWMTEALIGARYYGSMTNADTVDRLTMTDHPTFRSSWGKFGEHNAQLPNMYVAETSDGIIPVPIGLSTLVERSLKTCLPSIKSEMSLINSVIELKDFRSLPRTLRSMRTLLDRFGSDIYIIVRRFRKRANYKLELRKNPYAFLRSTFAVEDGFTLRELFRSTADGYLQAQFNILPLLRDIGALQTAIRDTSKKVNFLVNNQGKRQLKHYNFSWLNNQFSGANLSLGPLTYNTGQFAGSAGSGTGCYRAYAHGLRFERRVIIDPSLFHAEVEYNYYFTRAQTEHAQLYGIYDALGINLDPSIIWNAIPWSFLIDWVINVSRWLAKRKVLNLEPGVNISRYLWSWKQTRKVTTFFESTTNLGYKPMRTYLPTMYETIYRRDIKMPVRTDSLYGSGLSSTELSLGAALVITRALRPNRRLALTKHNKRNLFSLEVRNSKA